MHNFNAIYNNNNIEYLSDNWQKAFDIEDISMRIYTDMQIKKNYCKSLVTHLLWHLYTSIIYNLDFFKSISFFQLIARNDVHDFPRHSYL